MILQGVVYELYESDARVLSGHENDDLHALDREICLHFEDGRQVYLSWVELSRDFSVGYQDKPYFNPPVPVLLDMGGVKLWRNLIGKEISFDYRRSDKSLLEISAENSSVWCWAEGEFGSDVLHVSTKPPAEFV